MPVPQRSVPLPSFTLKARESLLRRCLVTLVVVATALSLGGVATDARPADPCSAPYAGAVHTVARDRLGDCEIQQRTSLALSRQPLARSGPAVTAASIERSMSKPATTAAAKASPRGTIVLGRSFPNSSNTGVPDAIKPQLTPYRGSCTITAKNVRIDRKIITCDQLRLLGPRTRITNSIIKGTVYSDCCYLNGSYSLTDSEVRGPNATATVVGEARFELTRVEVTGGSRSVFCNFRCVIRDSYLHGQYTDKRGIDHESGVRMDFGLTFVRNHVTCDAKPVPPDAGCSAAITGYGDFGAVRHNRIANNLIDGGPYGSMGYCAYGGSTPGKPYPKARHVRFVNNIFRRGAKGKCGIWGPVTSFDVKAPGNVWRNNLWDDGRPVRATM